MTRTAPVHYLWLLPEPASHRRLGRTVEDLMARLDCPPFEPHVTLLGSVPGEASDLIARTRRLAQRIAPFPIAVGRVEHSPQFFRCIYWAATLDPALAAARAQAERSFGQDDSQTAFCPHLSLVYGALEPDLRSQLGAAARTRGQPAAFFVDRLQLVVGAPDYRDWRAIGLFPLTGPQANIRGNAVNPDEVAM